MVYNRKEREGRGALHGRSHSPGQGLVRGFAGMGLALEREQFVLRTDDVTGCDAAVRAGLGIGFMARCRARGSLDLVPLLPLLPNPALPMWLAEHREIRSNPRNVRGVGLPFLGIATGAG